MNQDKQDQKIEQLEQELADPSNSATKDFKIMEILQSIDEGLEDVENKIDEVIE